MKREKLDRCFGKFLEMLKQLYVNIPFTEVLTQMPAYAKFLKEILSSKRKLEETIVVKLNAHCSAILQNKIPQKCGDPGSFTIPCSLGSEIFDKALCDSCAFISLMPLSIFKKFEGELGVIKYVPVSLQLDDYTTIIPEAIIEGIVVRVDKFVFPIDFIIVDKKVNKELDKMVGDSLERCITQSSIAEDEDPEIKKEAQALEDENQVVDEEEFEKERIKPKLELKVLPTHLKYAFLETNNFPIIFSADLIGEQEHLLVELLRKHRNASG
ncbi:PREDICTED: uncharacterized protein LOC109232512 [Nicotiana attenuata]|uniref:uncharacterized protein LOC109232512 n=1 Tax=Nicotiana attenuata TaxID=49451 RepID=UPI000905C292|nr:PREDICTED: uncharacterized protein LOC109232512 [Nicotiana attenuata]